MGNSVKIGFILMLCFYFKSNDDCYAQKFSKNEIKAAYVHNFIKFVQWPTDKTQLVLGIVGRNEFTAVLKSKLIDQKIGNYDLKIIHYSETNNIKKCDVLFVADDKQVNGKSILKDIENKSILSIGESAEFFEDGGMISLKEGGTGNFEFYINNTKALKSKIMISSKLLKLAFKIK